MDTQSRSVATFELRYTQFLDAHGEPTQPLPDFADGASLRKRYETMVRTRTFDTKAIALQRTGRMGTYPSSLGQEAISVAIGHAMQADDVLCPYYREYGAHFTRGVTMTDTLLFWGGDERGSDFSGPREDFPHCIPIASQCLHATGVATAFKLRKQPRVAVTVIGDGGTSKGDFYEALNVAGAWKLPVVFIVNNNQWAISVPRHAQTNTQTIAQKAIAAGIHGEQVDGNDVIAVEHAVRHALTRAREHGEASVIEAITYRLCDHTTADDARRYRDDAELEAAREKDPITRLRHYLQSQGQLSAADEETLKERCEAEVKAATERYENTAPQPVSSIFDSLYAELPESLQEQRAMAMAFAGETDV